MEKCFNKIESQAFFGSFYKTHIEGRPIFCDYFNTQTKMYCKRLKVMCPEHEKERKVMSDTVTKFHLCNVFNLSLTYSMQIGDEEVCGYPLPKSDNLLVDSENEICLASKRNCSLHFKWEKLRRAQIDLEKLRSVSSL
jgi:COMPASS component SPP1